MDINFWKKELMSISQLNDYEEGFFKDLKHVLKSKKIKLLKIKSFDNIKLKDFEFPINASITVIDGIRKYFLDNGYVLIISLNKKFYNWLPHSFEINEVKIRKNN